MTFTKKQVKNMANVSILFQLKRIAKDNGSHFFDKDSMRFFQSRIHDVVYGGCNGTWLSWVVDVMGPWCHGSRLSWIAAEIEYVCDGAMSL